MTTHRIGKDIALILLTTLCLALPSARAASEGESMPPQGEVTPGPAASQTEGIAATPGPATKQGYAGSNQCFICHRPETNTWSESKHSHPATDVLKEYQNDPNCQKCHVTGFGKPEGFVADTEKDLQMVGCEACHGPGAAHIDAAQRFVMAMPGEEEKIAQEMKETIIRSPDDTACVECHQGQAHHPHPSYNGQITEVVPSAESCPCGPAMMGSPGVTSSTPCGMSRYSIKTCGGCHYEKYKDWSTGKHADLASMLPANHASDPTCQGCHPAAGQTAITLTFDGRSAAGAIGATCENCHGPGLGHIDFNKQFVACPPLGPQLEEAARDTIRQGKPSRTCVQCHSDKGHKPHPVLEEK